MIEIGTVKAKQEKGVILVGFDHLGTEASCVVLQPSTGENSTFRLPSVGTQVVCWLEGGKNIALGAVFSDSEKVPSGADPEGLHVQYGAMQFAMADGKASLKNDSSDLKMLLKDILTTLQSLTVSTPMGPSGTPLPPTIQSVQKCLKTLDNLLK